MVKRHSSIPAPSVIDRDWPHQVALPDDLCTQGNLTKIVQFCQDHGLEYQHRQVQAVWPNGKYEDYRLHCFANAEAAKLFLHHFSGQAFDPKRDRENGKTRGTWRRTDEYRRILDLGPLSVPKILRS